MGKKLKLPFLSKMNSNSSADFSAANIYVSWPWPTYCQQPKTLSFRTENMFKTLNSAYFEASLDVVNDTKPAATESNCFTNSSESQSASFSTESDDHDELGSGESIESVIKGLRSERLFFKPEETSSILEETKSKSTETEPEEETEGESLLFPFKESVVLSMDSQDPYEDYKKSMEEMVEAHGLKDWESLEELLSCYLKVNGKNNHGYIIGAFVDLLVNLAFNSSSSSSSSDHSYISCSHSPSSPLSFYTSSNFSDDSSSSTHPCVSSSSLQEVQSEIQEN
ncbi:transcription repressor OFP15 [Mercurialis annua]|uniref:transcription repressor OFP15 n=1 Tax=Mercurialis annua TaxID=3986 RepID=UPI00215E04DF|nr:transcription repressor OFP15 [Mercurialis annua]